MININFESRRISSFSYQLSILSKALISDFLYIASFKYFPPFTQRRWPSIQRTKTIVTNEMLLNSHVSVISLRAFSSGGT